MEKIERIEFSPDVLYIQDYGSCPHCGRDVSHGFIYADRRIYFKHDATKHEADCKYKVPGGLIDQSARYLG